MKIYIAAPYAVRNELRSYAQRLKDKGHEITSSWLEATHEIHPGTLETAPALSDEYAYEHSVQDLHEVRNSDLVILVTWTVASRIAGYRELGGNSGGRHVEVGAALANHIPVVVWGQPENIFHRGLCSLAPEWEDVLEALDVVLV